MENPEQRDPELRVLTSSRDLDDYDILSTMTLSVAVPHQTTESYRKMIWAAMATYGFGNSSVDGFLRRYGGLWDKMDDKSFQRDPRIIALRDVTEAVDGIAAALGRVTPSPSLGHICSKAALCRLEASFKAAYGLVRKEYIFETDAVVRLILEQLAWSYAAYSASDEQVFKLSGSGCITQLKAVFPECGPIYGELNKWVHIDPSIARQYVEFHKAGAEVVRRSDVNAFQSGAYLVAFAPVYLKIVQELFSPFSQERHQAMKQRLEGDRKQYMEVMNEAKHSNG
jgi:hypothetical protein